MTVTSPPQTKLLKERIELLQRLLLHVPTPGAGANAESVIGSAVHMFTMHVVGWVCLVSALTLLSNLVTLGACVRAAKCLFRRCASLVQPCGYLGNLCIVAASLDNT
jgi:hypothetical protein